MAIKHKIVINVSDPGGRKANVLTALLYPLKTTSGYRRAASHYI